MPTVLRSNYFPTCIPRSFAQALALRRRSSLYGAVSRKLSRPFSISNVSPPCPSSSVCLHRLGYCWAILIAHHTHLIYPHQIKSSPRDFEAYSRLCANTLEYNVLLFPHNPLKIHVPAKNHILFCLPQPHGTNQDFQTALLPRHHTADTRQSQHHNLHDFLF